MALPVDSREIDANGKWNDISFDYPVDRSSWIAMRIYASAHTNPVFVTLSGKPIRELKSAEWCRKSVDQCWKMKRDNINVNERQAAEAAYENARKIYDKIIQEASNK